MLTELCQEIKNWFTARDAYGQTVGYTGQYTVENGKITLDFLQDGQYYRVIDSVFNDGVHCYGHEAQGELEDETFKGTICPMHIPKAVINLAAEIAEWRTKYEAADSPAMSPYMSESFGGYSYSKGSAYNDTGRGGIASWRTAFAGRMNMWRKL